MSFSKQRHVGRLLLYGLLAAYGAYLVIVNVALRGWLQERLSEEPGLWVQTHGAWSFWPGQVVADRLELDYQDSSVILRLRLDKLSTRISLLALLRTHFAASDIVAENADVHVWPRSDIQNAPEADEHETDESDSDEGWSVAIDVHNVRGGSVKVHRYRYLGDVAISGGFTLIPGERLELRPSRLDLTEGDLFDDGSHWCASEDCGLRKLGQFDAHFVASAPAHELYAGKALHEQLAATKAQLQGTLLDLQFLEVWLPRLQLSGGAGQLHVNMEIDRGRWRGEPKLKYVLTEPLEVRDLQSPLSATAHVASYELSLVRLPNQPPFTQHEIHSAYLEPMFGFARGEPQNRAHASVHLVANHATDRLSELVALPDNVSAQVREVSIPDAAALQALLPAEGALNVKGPVDARLSASWNRQGGLQGTVRATLSPVTFDLPLAPRARLSVATELEGAFSAQPDLTRGSLQNVSFKVTSASVWRSGESVKGWWAHFQIPRLQWEGWQLDATIHATLSNAELPLILLGVDQELPAAIVPVLSMPKTRLQLQLSAQGSGSAYIKIVKANSERVDLQGEYVRAPERRRGVFLATLGPIGAGIELSDGKTSVAPFVGNDWLKRHLPCSGPEEPSLRTSCP